MATAKRVAIVVLLGCLTSAIVASEKVIPSELCRGLWLVTLEYRDGANGGLLMVLDTGASPTSVDPDSIERVFGRRFDAGRSVTLRDGTAGPLELHKLKVRIHEMDHLMRSLGRDIDGILGMSVFKTILLTLDYGAGEVRVGKGRLPAPDGKTVFRDVGKVRPYLVLDVEGTRRAILVDSGSTGAFRLQPDDVADWAVEPRPTSANTGYDSIRINNTGRAAQTLQVGTLAAPRPIVNVSDGTRLIGQQIMNRFVWTFDKRNKRFQVIADGDAPIATAPTRGTGVAFQPVATGFKVVTIFPGSPALATALTKGDIVVAVDGVSLDDLDCSSGLAPQSDRVVFTVRRGDRQLEIPVEVVELVP